MNQYEILKQCVEKYRETVYAAEQYLWQHPEVGYTERVSNAYLKQQFVALGYTPIASDDIPGFYVDIDTGRPGPKVLVMCELDALLCPTHPQAAPDTGAVHACGHHAQCAAMLGIAGALREKDALNDLSGSIRLMAVPAEESNSEAEYLRLKEKGVVEYASGKIEYLRRGMMDGVDMAFLVHGLIAEPNHFLIRAGSNGLISKHVEFHGKAAHAGSCPFQGVNALYAANLALSAINALRETFVDDDHIRVHPIITNGGASVNIIPDEVELSCCVRGIRDAALMDANRKVNRAISASAAAIGATVSIHDETMTMPLNNDRNLMHMAELAAEEVVGRENLLLYPAQHTASSTDMGDIASVLPSIQFYCSGAAGTSHGSDYRVADVDSACMNSAKCQLILLHMLLSDDAKEAKRIIAEKETRFQSKEEMFDFYKNNLGEIEGVKALDERHTVLCY